ncbi:MAG: DUF1684 domain-containing protein [Pelagibacterales bacterium]|nr:DUF1684 domain-containing protein [Pelagibacterales bacterium]
MNRFLLVLFSLLLILNCENKKRYDKSFTPFQKEMNEFFKDASISPLKEKDLKTFKGLDFFAFDSSYVVNADLTRTPEEKSFKMKTTTDRLPEYIKYGIVTFDLFNKSYSLNIYKNLEDINKEGYREYLFLPFLDDTNGFESYGGGRYIDLDIPEGNNLVIDFNSAYNPYCVYDEKYSCPIVPRDNYLSIKINAGVKAFAKN